ncbi:MAG: RdgB/HAM1 family non-canonical purine NTP pyrophosphatase [Deltaproteobacteria bacterium]|nr:RdgB/HAM1 family non-canonical purine NTP pyrophosphatase [Deltaproteobacteria bacterium]
MTHPGPGELGTVVLATANPHKVAEIRAILAPFGIRCLELAAFPFAGSLPEDGATFEENALSKARAAFAVAGIPTVGDDSGLEVDALGGLPGVHSHRLTPEGTHEANNTELLRRLGDASDRRARFRCVVAVVTADGEAIASGVCEGRIAQAPRGVGGFGFDPIFLPDEAPGRTMAELTTAEKNALSHRGRAFRQVPALLSRTADSARRP